MSNKNDRGTIRLMLDIPTLVVLVGLLIFIAHVFAWLFSLTAIPDGLLLMLIGLVLGPFLHAITPDFFGGTGTVLLTIALVIMLFDSGLNLRVQDIRQAWSPMLRITITNFVVTMLVVTGIVVLLTPLELPVALMIGAMLGDINASVMLPLLQRLGIQTSAQTMLVLESALTDVFTIIVTIALLNTYQTGVFSIPGIAGSIMISFLGATIVGGVLGIAWALLLDYVRHLKNSIFVTPALVFIIFGVTEEIGLSGLVAALVFGITLGNMVHIRQYLQRRHQLFARLVEPISINRREHAFFSELVFLFQTFFFIYVGLSMTLSRVSTLLVALGITVALLVVRVIVIRATAPRSIGVREASFMSILIPKGLGPAVLALLLVEQHVPGAQVAQEIVYGVILASVVLTSLAVFLFEKTALRRLIVRLFAGFGTDSLPGIHPYG